MTGPFEKVYTMPGYYDGPREGIADFEGRPHLYESEWNDIDTDEESTYLLSPVDDATFQLALEAWEIWRRWERAHALGETSDETHPALPADRARRDELKVLLHERLVTAPSPVRAHGDFRRAADVAWDGVGHWPPLEVKWSRL